VASKGFHYVQVKLLALSNAPRGSAPAPSQKKPVDGHFSYTIEYLTPHLRVKRIVNDIIQIFLKFSFCLAPIFNIMPVFTSTSQEEGVCPFSNCVFGDGSR
jgi:hypothetical protein